MGPRHSLTLDSLDREKLLSRRLTAIILILQFPGSFMCHRVARVAFLLVAGVAFLPALAQITRLDYPAAPRGTVVDDYHGTRVADPFRSLEDLDAPATRSWVEAEDALTRNYLGSLPGREALRARLKSLADYDRHGVPFQAGGRVFYTRNTGFQDQSVLYVADTPDAPARVALDPNTLSVDDSIAVTGYVASHNGRLLAYGAAVSGSDWTDWHVRNLDRGQDLPDVLRFTKYYSPVFSLDDKGLYYSAFPAPLSGTELTAADAGNAVWYHPFAGGDDRKVFEVPGHPDWQYLSSISDDGRWLVVAAGEGEVGDKNRENVYLLDLSRPGSAPLSLVEGFDAAYVYIGSDAGRLFFLTNRKALNGRVIAVDPAQPSIDAAPTIIMESQEAIDFTTTSVTLVDHSLLVRSIRDAHSHVQVFDLAGRVRFELKLPAEGVVTGLRGGAEDRGTFYSFANMIDPGTVYRYDLSSGKSRVFDSPHVNFDRQHYEQRQVFYRVKDGTRIPLLMAFRRGLKRNGANPTVLYGYGGFGIPMLPNFNATRIAWLERGGIYAIAGIRGGGEYGESWHEQGRLAHKQVVFDDFIAAAEWLKAQRYTSTAKLAIRGGSNGGLLVGACLTQHPDLFAAAIAQVGVMDMLRFDLFGQGAGWTGEFGSPRNPAEFPALYAYSPLHHVRDGTRYPATLITTGDHDSRVMPAHSFKFTAALQAAQSGPEPILLDLEKSSGHGGGAKLSQVVDQAVDMYSFLADRLGVSPEVEESPQKR